MNKTVGHASLHMHPPPARFDVAADQLVQISIVIPLYNEQDNVIPTYESLRGVMSELGRSYEILFIDDGSSDQTAARLVTIAARDPAVKIITLARNFGQTAAIMAGMDHVRGEVLAIMDGDGQNDAHDIPNLLAKLDEAMTSPRAGGSTVTTRSSLARSRAGPPIG